MKTIIDIADGVLAAAKQLASSEGSTLRSLVEAGLRQVLADRKKRAGPFRLRRASFKGRGLKPELRERTWEQVRELAYEGHGG